MHFPVLVVTKEYPTSDVLNEVMDPYREWDCTAPTKYGEFYDETDYYRNLFDDYYGGDNDDFLEYLKEETGAPVRRPSARVEAIPYHYPEGYILHDKQADSVRFFAAHNPNSKWDWWVVGGRFEGVFDGKTRGPYPSKANILPRGELSPNFFKREEQIAKRNWRLVRNSWGNRPMEFKSLKEAGSVDKLKNEPFVAHVQELVPPSHDWSITDPVPYTLPFEEGVEIMVLEQTRLARCIIKDGIFYDPDDLYPAEYFPFSTFDKYAWGRKYKEIFDTIEDDEWLTIVDIHI